MENFDNLSEQIKIAIKRLGFTEPTQIQKKTIPLIMEGKDIIGESATGSGKTLAFGIGIIDKSLPNEGIQALVLVPTRELAEQVKEEIIKISFKKSLRITAIYGGMSINTQINQLKVSDIVIATPGRLLDHLNRRTVNLSKVKLLVLDEADRMIDMGFIHDVEKIISMCPKERQTLLFSATMHDQAQQLAKRYMINPVTIHAVKMVDPKKMKQCYYDVPSKLKKDLLITLLKKEESDLVMVFCNTRKSTDIVAEALKINQIKSSVIHGGLNQSKRLNTIESFHEGKFRVLVCTDVAARGLDIQGITHIYNFDIPKEPGDYVHRIGRTARAGKEGLVINILCNRDYDNFSRIISHYSEFEIHKEERPFIKETIQSPKEKPKHGRYSGKDKAKRNHRVKNRSRR